VRSPGPEQILALFDDAERCARLAGLRYVYPNGAGISRRGHGRGFSYRHQGVPIVEDPTRATGLDDRGRRQYLYHQAWRTVRDWLNAYRLIAVGERLPAVRAHTAAELRRHSLDSSRVLAVMLAVLDLTGMRIGNEIYTDENDSFGLCTLTKRHVAVTGTRVEFRFPAKSGRLQQLMVTDAPIARATAGLLELPGRRLFRIDGRPVSPEDINSALGTLTGRHVTAKDFRTWRGTLCAFRVLTDRTARSREPEPVAIAAVDAAAAFLGNTRAVARAHYVHPDLIECYLDERFATYLHDASPSRRPLLATHERRLLGVLRRMFDAEFTPRVLPLLPDRGVRE
jgi:DNA topoisomerase-1